MAGEGEGARHKEVRLDRSGRSGLTSSYSQLRQNQSLSDETCYDSALLNMGVGREGEKK